MCEDLRLLEPAALGLTSAIKAAGGAQCFSSCEVSEIFLPRRVLDVLHKAASQILKVPGGWAFHNLGS